MSHISESFPKPGASAETYAAFLWQTALFTGDTTYPDALDLAEPEECTVLDEHLASFATMPQEKFEYHRRELSALILSHAQYELKIPNLHRADAKPHEFDTVHVYLSGPVTLQGSRLAIQRQFVPRESGTYKLQPFKRSELVEAVWSYRDDRRQTANFDLIHFLDETVETI